MLQNTTSFKDIVKEHENFYKTRKEFQTTSTHKHKTIEEEKENVIVHRHSSSLRAELHVSRVSLNCFQMCGLPLHF